MNCYKKEESIFISSSVYITKIITKKKKKSRYKVNHLLYLYNIFELLITGLLIKQLHPKIIWLSLNWGGGQMQHDIHQLLHNTVHHFIKTKLNHCAIVTFSTAACIFFISALDHEYITNFTVTVFKFCSKILLYGSTNPHM